MNRTLITALIVALAAPALTGCVAAVATGVAGVFIETHDDPDNTTSSDGPNMVRLSDMAGLLEQLMAIDAIVKG